MEGPQQGNLFTRGRQLNQLNGIQLPESHMGVSAKIMQAVLRCLDDHARDKATCCVGVIRIRECTKISKGQIYRALGALRDLTLIDRERRSGGRSHGRLTNRYRIVWSNVSADDSCPDTTSRSANTESRPENTTSRSAPTLNRLSKRVLEPPPPNPLKTEQPRPAASAGERNSEWDRVEAEILKDGVKDPGPAIEAARASVSPAIALDLIAVYRQHAGAWGPGALRWRLLNARPGESPGDLDLWPPRRVDAAAERQHARELAATQRLLQESEARAAAAKRRGPWQPLTLLSPRHDAAGHQGSG